MSQPRFPRLSQEACLSFSRHVSERYVYRTNPAENYAAGFSPVMRVRLVRFCLASYLVVSLFRSLYLPLLSFLLRVDSDAPHSLVQRLRGT